MRFIATFLLCFIATILQAQVEIQAEQDQDRNLTLIGMNKGVIPYTIRIEFSKLENLESQEGNILFKVANPGKSNLLKLRSIYVNEPTGFNYKTQLYKGNFQLGNQEQPPYLIPVVAGTAVSMRPLTVQAPKNTKTTGNQSYVGILFSFEGPSVICAPRKGIVSEIKMDGKETSSGPADLNSENFLEIYHQDGTFSRLTGLKANSAKVTVGETVFPGQPVAESSQQLDQTNHHVKMIQSRWEMGEAGVVWVNFPVNIFTDPKGISSTETLTELKSVHPSELITKEMDKKELKKYGSN